jgi:hypothetical protein
MEPVLARLGASQNEADAIADLHTRSRQVAYRGLYGDAYLDRELFDVSRAERPSLTARIHAAPPSPFSRGGSKHDRK